MATKTETEVSELKINYLSEDEYNTALSAGEINENEIYMTPLGNSESSGDITVAISGSGNAITALTASGSTITATKGSTFLTSHPTISKSTNTTSTASPSHGGTFTAIDSVTQDTNGHITKVNTKTITLPEDNNTDTKVTQTSSATNNSYPLLASSSTSPTSGSANTSIYNTGVTVNPSTKTITATTFNGSLSGNATSSDSATTASKLGSSNVGSATKPIYLSSGTATASSSTVGGADKPMYLNSGTMTACSSTVGSTTQPVYMSSGTITACSYTLGKSVPSNAVFTDTTYSNATTSTAGLMSSTDKKKLDGALVSLDDVDLVTEKGTLVDAMAVAELHKAMCWNSGDSYTFGTSSNTGALYIGGHITGDKTNICFAIPLAKPVTATGVTVSNLSLVVRQNGNYLVGSASSYASVSNIAAKLGEGYISVTVTVSTMSSATNNDSASISAKGKITFN